MGIQQFPIGDTTIEANELLYDPVNKLRVSTPQSLIDTDFEYGTQISKWENLTLTDNRPFVYNAQTPLEGITAISLPNLSRTVTVSTTTPPTVGTAITVTDTFLPIANGNFIVESVAAGTSFTYTARSENTTTVTSLFDSNKTQFFQGAFYTGAQIGTAPTISYSNKKVNVTTTVPHGLSIGNEIAVKGITTTGANPPNGAHFVASIISATQFVYYVITAPTGTLTTTSAQVFARPQGQFLHRPFDGGVIFSSNSTSNYQSAIRQTRRYFRYQSGKGIQMSSGTLIKPSLQLESLTSVGTLVTVQTKEKHNLQPGSAIDVFGANESAYNGTFTVYTVTGFNTFTYTALSVPSASTASGLYYANISEWFGCVNRIGIFDSQNGMFFQHNGQELSAVIRASTYQISGRVTVTNGSPSVTQTNASFPTRFAKQLEIDDYIVIRGMSYRIIDIASDTSMTISPAYRGTTSNMVIASKTVDRHFPQSEWNIDKMDGTGPSGYNADFTKMQMWFIDYSWYGAGSVRFGLRGTDGEIKYCHKIMNNNLNSEAYMRSGNLPARYESSTEPPFTKLTSSLSDGAASMSVVSTNGFPAAGTLLVCNNLHGYEYVNYAAKTATSFTGLTRAKAGVVSLATTVASGQNVMTVSSTTGLQVGQRVFGVNSPDVPENTFISSINSATSISLSQAITATNPTCLFAPMNDGTAKTFTFSATNPVNVELAFPTYAPTISHWGTSAIMDGRYDDDKSLLFTYGQTTVTTIPSGGTRNLLAIRVAPSVDNGTSGPFGSRELINRMQLILRALDITTSTTNANLLITAVLNGTPTVGATWTKPATVTSSLSQVADYGGISSSINGGETTGGFFLRGNASSIDLTTVRDLGNSVLGGGEATSSSGIYPDGPDTLHVVVRNLGSFSVQVFARLSWTEAQA
jgi:hypothetical protein